MCNKFYLLLARNTKLLNKYLVRETKMHQIPSTKKQNTKKTFHFFQNYKKKTINKNILSYLFLSNFYEWQTKCIVFCCYSYSILFNVFKQMVSFVILIFFLRRKKMKQKIEIISFELNIYLQRQPI